MLLVLGTVIKYEFYKMLFLLSLTYAILALRFATSNLVSFRIASCQWLLQFSLQSKLIAGATTVLSTFLFISPTPHSSYLGTHYVLTSVFLSKLFHDDIETIKLPSRVKVPLLRRHSCPSCTEDCWKSNIYTTYIQAKSAQMNARWIRLPSVVPSSTV